MRIDPGAFEFEWDRGNIGKNKAHGVEDSEAEEAFFDERKLLLRDSLHSASEDRFILLGRTKPGRMLLIVYTKRGRRFRVISARDMKRTERPLYEEAT